MSEMCAHFSHYSWYQKAYTMEKKFVEQINLNLEIW